MSGWSRGIIAIVLIALAGCTRPSLRGAVPTADPRPVLRIGLVGASPGPGALEGAYTGDAAELAIDQINQAGGVIWQSAHYRLALAFGNGGDLTTQVQALVVAAPPIVALLGPDESAPALATGPLAVRAQVPQLTISTGAVLADPAQRPGDQWTFRMRPPDAEWARAVTRAAIEQLGGHVIAVAALTSEYGRQGAATILATLAELGRAPTAQVALAPGLADPAAAVAQILAAHPDTLICWSTEPEAATLVRALHAARWHGQFVVGAVDGDLIALAGQDGEGIVGATNWTPEQASPADAAFLAAYQARYGQMPDEHAAAMYDAVGLLAAALAAVGPDHAALAAYLAHVSGYQGVQGRYDAKHARSLLGAPGDLTARLDIVRIQNAQPTIIATSGE